MKEPRLIELTELKPGYLASINNLLSQLSDSVHTITEEELNTLLSSSQSHLYVLESDGQFIGMSHPLPLSVPYRMEGMDRRCGGG